MDMRFTTHLFFAALAVSLVSIPAVSGVLPKGSIDSSDITKLISQLTEVEGCQLSNKVGPKIWSGSCDYEADKKQPWPSDKLRRIGIKALPFLFNQIRNDTETRTIYHTSRPPFSYPVTIGWMCRTIFFAICDDNNLEQPQFLAWHIHFENEEQFENARIQFDQWYIQIAGK